MTGRKAGRPGRPRLSDASTAGPATPSTVGRGRSLGRGGARGGGARGGRSGELMREQFLESIQSCLASNTVKQQQPRQLQQKKKYLRAESVTIDQAPWRYEKSVNTSAARICYS